MFAKGLINKKHSQFPMCSKFALKEWFYGSQNDSQKEAFVFTKIGHLHFVRVEMFHLAEMDERDRSLLVRQKLMSDS